MSNKRKVVRISSVLACLFLACLFVVPAFADEFDYDREWAVDGFVSSLAYSNDDTQRVIDYMTGSGKPAKMLDLFDYPILYSNVLKPWDSSVYIYPVNVFNDTETGYDLTEDTSFNFRIPCVYMSVTYSVWNEQQTLLTPYTFYGSDYSNPCFVNIFVDVGSDDIRVLIDFEVTPDGNAYSSGLRLIYDGGNYPAGNDRLSLSRIETDSGNISNVALLDSMTFSFVPQYPLDTTIPGAYEPNIYRYPEIAGMPILESMVAGAPYGGSGYAYPKSFLQGFLSGASSAIDDTEAWQLGYDRGYFVGSGEGFSAGEEYGYQSGFDDGYRMGIGTNASYQDGYDTGYNDAVNQISSGEFGRNLLGNTFSAPFEALSQFTIVSWELQNGNQVEITLGAVLSAVIGVGLFIWFLKLFAGG